MTLEWANKVGRQVGKWRIDSLLKGHDRHASYAANANGKRGRLDLVMGDADEANVARRSWEIAKKLTSEHLIAVYDTGETKIDGERFLFLASELPDDAVSDFLAGRVLEADEARAMAAAAANALAFLHGRTLRHGSVSPSNMMLVGENVKLDIGTLAPADEAGREADLKQLGSSLVEAMTGSAPSMDAARRLPPPFREIAIGCLDPARTRWTADRVLQALDGRAAAAGAAPAAAPVVVEAIAAPPPASPPSPVPPSSLAPPAPSVSATAPPVSMPAAPISAPPPPPPAPSPVPIPVVVASPVPQPAPPPVVRPPLAAPSFTMSAPPERKGSRLWILALVAGLAVIAFFIFRSSTTSSSVEAPQLAKSSPGESTPAASAPPSDSASEPAAGDASSKSASAKAAASSTPEPAAPVRTRERVNTPKPEPAAQAPASSESSIAAEGSGSGSWAVIAATYNDFPSADRRAKRLAELSPGLQTSVHPPEGHGSRYFVLLGSGLSKQGAEQVRRTAAQHGAPKDAYVSKLTEK